MNVQEIIIEVFQDIIGIEKEELDANMDTDLFNEGILDSLAIVTTLNEVSNRLNTNIILGKIQPKDMRTIRGLITAVEHQIE